MVNSSLLLVNGDIRDVILEPVDEIVALLKLVAKLPLSSMEPEHFVQLFSIYNSFGGYPHTHTAQNFFFLSLSFFL